MAEGHKIRSALFFLIKIALASGIVWYLFHRNRGAIIDCFRSFDYRWLIPAMFFYFCHIAVCSERWRELAKILGIRLGHVEALSLTMQGNFFSLVIPGGAVGGDVVKMGFVSGRSKSGTKMEGAFTVLMDRIIGMIALFVFMLALLIPAYGLLMNISIPDVPLTPPLKQLLIAGLALLCCAGLGASCAIFFHRSIEKWPLVGGVLRRVEQLGHGAVSRITGATDIYAGRWRTLTGLTGLSIVGVHLMTAVPFFFLLRGLQVDYSVFNVVTAVMVGNIAGLIPLFPSGIGIRDLTTITILAAGGIAPGDAKTCQLLATGIILFFNLAGGAFFVCDPGRRASTEPKNE